MRKLKIVLSINSCWNIVNFRSGLVRALVEAGHEVVAAAPPDEWVDRLVALGCRFEPIPLSGRGRSVIEDGRLLLAYRRLLRRERPDAYLAWTIKPNIYGSLAAHSAGVPVINNVAGLGTTFMDSGPLNRVIRLLYRAAISRSRTVFFQNPDDMRLFIDSRLVGAGTARLLPGSGVDTRRFVPPDAAPPADGRFVFLLVARLLKSKGVAQFVEAGRGVRAADPSVVLRVAGILDEAHPDGIPEGQIRAWHQEGAIDYLGPLDDVRPALAEADCVVLPTFYPEGTPRSLLEAAASGKPLIATDVPGCRDVVQDGLNGYLVRPRDVAALAEAMGRMASATGGQLATMGARSRERAVTRFDERIVIDRYLEALAKIAGA